MDAARLRRDADISAVWSEGRKLQHALFAVRARPNGLAAIRIAVSAPSSLGHAVERNRARRRIREAFRLAIQEMTPGEGRDLVVVARPAVAAAPHGELREAAAAALRAIESRAMPT